METGIFIRAEVNGKWGNYDIGDKALNDVEVVRWMRQCYRDNGVEFYERLVLACLERNSVMAAPGVVA